MPPFSQRAETVAIDGPAGKIDLRVIAPKSPRGILFHIHGGGWSLGAPELNDPLLESIADGANVACVSVEYRLAPEHPYPAGPDDCEAAALWLARSAAAEFGTTRLWIGGESAGAHLAVLTLLRLRDRHKLGPFCRREPGVRLLRPLDVAQPAPLGRAQPGALDADHPGVRGFFVPDPARRRDPDVSPLYADLAGMPPALFTVGTLDPLLDDSLFLTRAGSRPAVTPSSPSGPAASTALPAFRSRSAITAVRAEEEFIWAPRGQAGDAACGALAPPSS